MTIEIVDFPLENGGSFHRFLYLPGRVYYVGWQLFNTSRIKTFQSFSGGAMCPSWKMMEFVNGFRMTSQYMKWKIIQSCSKPPTSILQCAHFFRAPNGDFRNLPNFHPPGIQIHWSMGQEEKNSGNFGGPSFTLAGGREELEIWIHGSS